MKKTLIIILIISFIFVGCAPRINLSNSIQEKLALAEQALNEGVSAPAPTPKIVPNAQAAMVADTGIPKYVFLLIGDGFGEGHLRMGELSARINNESMQKGASWESFDVKQMTVAGTESASGGTALSTGYMAKPGAIAIDRKLYTLTTILDRAKQNGLATGVVTNSNIQDATPAVFLAHAESRLDVRDISEGLVYSDVDYIAGGGLNFVITRDQAKDFDYMDVSQNELKPNNYATYETLLEEEYTLYLGLPGAIEFLDKLEKGQLEYTKTLCAFSELVMPYEPTKLLESYIERMEYVPSLVDMTKAGIQILEQNENGFVMMIEEALIDKAEHNDKQGTALLQADLLDRTIKEIMVFVDEHPNECLIIFTVDHETGSYRVMQDKFDAFLQLPDFEWTADTKKMNEFLKTKWDVRVNYDKLYNSLKLYSKNLWDTEEENKAPTKALIAYGAALHYGIHSYSDTHSHQIVPCYVHGVGAERFVGIERIDQVPIILCELMGWQALPEQLELLE